MSNAAATTIRKDGAEHRGFYTKPKRLLIIAPIGRAFSMLADEFDGTKNKQRGWTISGALVDMHKPETNINPDGTLNERDARLNGCAYAFDTPEHLKAILHGVKPDAILLHEGSANYTIGRDFSTVNSIAEEIGRIMPGVPMAVMATPHILDGLDDLDGRPEGHEYNIVKRNELDYSSSPRELHKFLKAGVDKRRGKEIQIN